MFLKKILRKFSKSVSGFSNLHILSAVRTPAGLLNGKLSVFTAPQLGSFAINEALLRGIVPSEDLQNLFLGCISNTHCQEEIKKRVGLSNTAKISLTPTSGLTNLIEGIRFLLTSDRSLCLAGEMESITNSSSGNTQADLHQDVKKVLKSYFVDLLELNKYAKKDSNNFMNANMDGAFWDEILKIDFRKKGQKISVFEDEIFKNDLVEGDALFKWLPVLGDGAAALIISTEEYSNSNNLVPLAKIISFGEEHGRPEDLSLAQARVIEKVLRSAECKVENIMRWEILSVMNKVVVDCESYFNIHSSRINKNGGVFSLGYPVGISGVRAVCHLVHSLNPGELGCVATYNFNGNATAIIIEKFEQVISLGRPRLTLYTTHTCTLCDELKEKLKTFEGRFLLEEIDIQMEENRKFKELYEYDIPVLFLNGTFLCKHRLNVQQFSRRFAAAGANLSYNENSSKKQGKPWFFPKSNRK